MINIICAAIAALATIICAWIAANTSRAEKARKIKDESTDRQSQERIKESRLQLAMIAANSELTVGVAMALKNGQCNGEVEAGLHAVEKANREYTRFLEEVAIEHINKEVGA